MNTLLFIPALLAGDTTACMVKVAVVVLLWLIVIVASMIDLATGIAASKRLGQHHTTSWGLRRTISKDLQYLALLVMLLLIDVALSALSPYLGIFTIPLLSVAGVTTVTIVEFVSVVENTRKGKSPEEDAIDDVQQLAAAVVDAYGEEKVKAILEAIQTYHDKKKA